jgi:hypothetical protein
LDVVLTSGEYELIIFDAKSAAGDAKRFLGEAGMTKIPFGFSLTATPIVQNEDR